MGGAYALLILKRGKMEYFGNYLINRVRKTNLNGVPPCIGCSHEEIENLMKDQGVSRLPRFYREYLEVMGKSGLMNIHAGSDWSCNRLLKIKQDWQNDLTEVKIDFVIPEKSFVFFQHGGYEYRYFMTDHDNDDCPTYLYLEDNSEQGYKVSIDVTLREFFEDHADFYGKTGKFKDT